MGTSIKLAELDLSRGACAVGEAALAAFAPELQKRAARRRKERQAAARAAANAEEEERHLRALVGGKSRLAI